MEQDAPDPAPLNVWEHAHNHLDIAINVLQVNGVLPARKNAAQLATNKDVSQLMDTVQQSASLDTGGKHVTSFAQQIVDMQR